MGYEGEPMYDMYKDCQIQVFEEDGKWFTEDDKFLFILSKSKSQTEEVWDYNDYEERVCEKCPKVIFLFDGKIMEGALYDEDEYCMTIVC